MRFGPVFLLLSATLAISQTPDPTPNDARISGTVVDAAGKPVPNAIVYAERQLAPLRDAYRVQATTDRAGHFDFGAKLRHGIYDLYASNDQDRYPAPHSAFYRSLDFNPETVQLYG